MVIAGSALSLVIQSSVASMPGDLGLYLHGDRTNLESHEQNQEVSFLEAKENPDLIPLYLVQFFRKYEPPTGALFKYREKGIDGKERVLTFGSYSGNKFFFSDEKVYVKVEGLVLFIEKDDFDIKSEDEFLSETLDRKYAYLNILLGNVRFEVDKKVDKSELTRRLSDQGDLAKEFLQLYSYFNQINCFPQRKNLTDSYKVVITYLYHYHRSIIERQEPTLLTKWILDIFPENPVYQTKK